ncbi:hypothetical protein NPIL_327771 [Nephila pilipes]|uniref:Spider venom protein n=1 Tax=Nephila pilipes TaxID=299642 RepID=A0A8X6QTY5_NEPPI|nr:hypothetical protein NPIL_327771 [Nephila pilipes]
MKVLIVALIFGAVLVLNDAKKRSSQVSKDAAAGTCTVTCQGTNCTIVRNGSQCSCSCKGGGANACTVTCAPGCSVEVNSKGKCNCVCP